MRARKWSWGLRLIPLELPGREAPNVDVEPVEARVVAVTLELDFKL
jgi:hypothetical protein